MNDLPKRFVSSDVPSELHGGCEMPVADGNPAFRRRSNTRSLKGSSEVYFGMDS